MSEAAFLEGPNLPPNIHLTARQAAAYASQAGVGKLVLTHLQPWNNLDDARAEAASEFSGDLGRSQPYRRASGRQPRSARRSARSGPVSPPCPRWQRVRLARVSGRAGTLAVGRHDTSRRKGRGRAAAGADYPKMARPRRGLGARRVREDPGAVRRERHRGGAALAAGERARLGDRRVRDAARGRPTPATTASRSRAASAAGLTRSPGWSAGRCAPASTTRRSARTRSSSTATSCRRTAAPGPPRSPAGTWRSPTRSTGCASAASSRATRWSPPSPRSASASSTASPGSTCATRRTRRPRPT